MSNLNAYIPMDRRQALANHQTLSGKAQGTALFADISGFTPLTAVLADELGPQRGAEALTSYLNTIYGRLIDIVHQYQGSVVGFSGDAITCWFDKDNGVRGMTTAYEMQQVMAAMDDIITPSGQKIHLGIKTAVAAGTTRRFLVGNSQINHLDILAGSLLDTLAAIEQSLSRGEIGIDISIAPILAETDNSIALQKTAEGAVFFKLTDAPPEVQQTPWINHDAIQPEIAGQWLLPAVQEQLERGQAEFLAELRPVVAFFVKFSGIDYDDDPQAEEKLNAFIQHMQMIVTRYGGHLLELTMGDKGSYIYAVFGAPNAHENDADRAMDAAWDLLESSSKFDYLNGLQMGLSRGRMRTGAYGSASRRIYGVHGMDVNLAARLMTEAKLGQILVSKNMVESSRTDRYFFHELGDLQLKGFAQPIATYEMLNREENAPTPAPIDGDIIGRDSERFLLNQYLHALRSEESNLVLVEGDAGIGKSYLISDVLKTAQSRNLIYLYGAGDAINQTTPYYAWRMVMQRVLGVSTGEVILDDAKRLERQRQILARLYHLDPALPELAPLLNIFLPLDFPETELTRQMSEVARADNIHDLAIRLLQETAVSTPLLLILEDAHWFDSGSWTLLGLVQRAVLPLFIIVTTRPQTAPVPAEYSRLLNRPDTHHMVLNTLSTEAINQLICRCLHIHTLPPSILTLIHEKAEGHPFFSEELAYALRDEQVIQIKDGVCQLSPNVEQLSNLSFPDTIQGVIISRLDRLSSQQQITLKVASIIGRLFAYHILQDVYPVTEDKAYLKGNLTELEILKITLQETPEPNLSFIFKHIITQEVAYNLMTFEQRQQLHQRVAEAYELYYAQDMNIPFELLAYHWSKAENSLNAIYYVEKAGEQAVRNAANEEAIYFFTQALDLDKKAGFICEKKRRARWHLMAGEAYVNWSHYQEGLTHLDTGLALLDKPKPPDATFKKAGMVMQQVLKQAIFHWRSPQPDKKTAEERDDLLIASRAYARLVEVDYHRGDILGSMFDSFYALNLAEEAGPSAEFAEAAAPVGIVWSLIPWRGLAESYLARAVKIGDESGNTDAYSYALMVQATYFSGIGDWDKAENLCERIITVNQQLGARRLNDGYHHLARLYYLQGRYEESQKTAVSLINSSKKLNERRFEAYGLQCQAYNLLYTGQLQDALNNLETLRQLCEDNEINDAQMELDTLGLLGLTHLRLDNLTEAFTMAGLTYNLADPFPSSYYNLPGYASPAEIYLALWEQGYPEPTLPKLVRQASKLLNSFARIFTMGKPRSYLVKGLDAWQRGQKRKAYKAWQKGVTSAETLKMPYEQARLYYELGRHAETESEQQAYLLQAQTIFKELGTPYELKQLEKLTSDK